MICLCYKISHYFKFIIHHETFTAKGLKAKATGAIMDFLFDVTRTYLLHYRSEW